MASTATVPERREGFEARSYAHARRYEWQIGKIGEWTLPFGPYSPAQIGVCVAAAVVLWKTMALWSGRLPFWVVILVLVGVPVAAMFAIRRVRVEGRSPVFALVGAARSLGQHRHGTHGRTTAAPPQPEMLTHRRCLYAEWPTR